MNVAIPNNPDAAFLAGQRAQFEADCHELCWMCKHPDWEPAVFDPDDEGYWHTSRRNRKGTEWCDATPLLAAWSEAHSNGAEGTQTAESLAKLPLFGGGDA